MSVFYHEQLYRSAELMARVCDFRVTVCGAGALGANITESLARTGFASLRVIDRDRVEERNLSTQPYYRRDAGAYKARILANSLYRALGVKLDALTDELTVENAARLIGRSALVIDAFDNSAARRAVKQSCERAGLPCLHTGLAGDYAEVIWNESYRVPSAAQDDVCDYPLARNLVTLTVAIACEAVIAFAARGERLSYTATLRDFAVRQFSTG
ncbi:MAG TPA: ThiF family adenylyltransferase [Pyrinomonadaceae bacterium]|jgi:molybdopterin/thiamine biosynthesis adenylyltransferase